MLLVTVCSTAARCTRPPLWLPIKVIEDIFCFSVTWALCTIRPQATAMKACQEVFGKDTPMVAVFDTSFHQTMRRKGLHVRHPL